MIDDDNIFHPDLKLLREYEKEDLVRVIERASERMKVFEFKHFKLVKYARSGGKDGPWAAKARAVEAQYPEETRKLIGDYGDWEHGFNSGCLATVRLLMDNINTLQVLDSQLQYVACLNEQDPPVEGEELPPPWTEEDVLAEAEEEFPDLDT